MQRFLQLSVFILSLFFISCSGNKEESVKLLPVTTDSELALAYYETAIIAFDQIKYADAIDNLKSAVKEDPDFFMAYYWLYPLAGKNSKKVAELAFQIETELSEGEAILLTAFKYLVDGQNEKAVEQVEMIISLYPNDVMPYKILYLLQFQFFKDMESARKTIEAAIRVKPDHAISYNMLGYALMDLEEYDAAEKALDKYIELAPGIANPYDSKGDYLMKVNKYEEAYESYMKAYSLDSGFYISLKKAEKAKKLIESDESI